LLPALVILVSVPGEILWIIYEKNGNFKHIRPYSETAPEKRIAGFPVNGKARRYAIIGEEEAPY
jgi:hypothetical protein